MKTLPIVLSAAALTFSAATFSQTNKTPTEFIDMFEKLSGKHPGLRKAHASGVCAEGTFSPNKSLTAMSSSGLFTADAPVTMRFSMGSGHPQADQRMPGARGMAMQFTLADGSMHTMAGNSTPVFAAKDPDTFFGLLETLLPNEQGNVDMAKVGQYIATHPSTQPAAQWQQTTPPPYSFGTVGYFGLHTFYFVDEAGKQTKFRWNITPDAGEKLLDPTQMTSLPAQFLADHFEKQFNADGVSFTVHATLGQAEDTDIDPSQAWPAEREKMQMGTITVTSVGGDKCKGINFDPNIVSAGFATSDDPVLKMRSPAYAISFGKRLSGQ